MIASLAIPWSAPGLSQFLYNQKADDQAKAALDEYRTSRDAHLGIFKTRRDTLTTLANRLDEAITASVRADRDAVVIEVLDLSPTAQVERLKDKTDRRLESITGFKRSELVTAAPASTIGILLDGAGLGPRIEGVRPFIMPSSFSEESAQNLLKDFPGAHEKLLASAGAGGSFFYKDFCHKQVIRDPAANPPVKPLLDVIAIIRGLGIEPPVPVAAQVTAICNDVVKSDASQIVLPADEKYNALKGLAGYELSSDLTMLTTSEAVMLGQNLSALKGELDKAKGEIKAQASKAAPLKAARAALEKARENGAWDQVSKLADDLAKALGKPDQGGDATASEPACGGKITMQCARDVAEQLGLVDFDRLRASVAAEIAGYLADPDALAKATESKCGKPGVLTDETRRVCLAFAGMETLRLLDQARDVAARRPGQIAELAILITSAESRIADAQARSTGLVRRIDNLAAQRQALVTEVRLLSDAREPLDRSDVDARGPLLVFARSYDEGRLPYDRLFDRQQLLKLQSFNDREEQVVRARYAIADGLLQTVSTATASGLKPEDAAGFLSAIGITTLGITEAVK
ncbi:hypothetical protein QTN93_15075 [Sphingomonas aerolata]|uniref:hypothetical protein n=1 Tax=Sphingomonas aerolata TaxID=185951 RepID=UPI0035A5940E